MTDGEDCCTKAHPQGSRSPLPTDRPTYFAIDAPGTHRQDSLLEVNESGDVFVHVLNLPCCAVKEDEQTTLWSRATQYPTVTVQDGGSVAVDAAGVPKCPVEPRFAAAWSLSIPETPRRDHTMYEYEICRPVATLMLCAGGRRGVLCSMHRGFVRLQQRDGTANLASFSFDDATKALRDGHGRLRQAAELLKKAHKMACDGEAWPDDNHVTGRSLCEVSSLVFNEVARRHVAHEGEVHARFRHQGRCRLCRDAHELAAATQKTNPNFTSPLRKFESLFNLTVLNDALEERSRRERNRAKQTGPGWDGDENRFSLMLQQVRFPAAGSGSVMRKRLPSSA